MMADGGTDSVPPFLDGAPPLRRDTACRVLDVDGGWITRDYFVMIHLGRQRRSIRLRGYDYTQAGAYFITICARDRLCVFAEDVANVTDLTPIGEIVTACWEAIPEHFPTAELDAFVVMPNHVHGIVVLGAKTDDPGDMASQGTACRAQLGTAQNEIDIAWTTVLLRQTIAPSVT